MSVTVLCIHKVYDSSKNILHVSDASKSLVYVNRLTRDNNAFVEFHPDKFLIREQQLLLERS
jgi:hypothetical protein